MMLPLLTLYQTLNFRYFPQSNNKIFVSKKYYSLMKSLKKRKTEMNLIESNIQNDFVYIEVKDWGSRLKQTG